MEKIIITGHLGQDTRLSQHNAETYASFSVGTNRRRKTDTGTTEITTWYNCTWWRPNKATDYMRKGQQVLVEGTPSVRMYQNRAGQTVAAIDIVVTSVELLGKNTSQESRTELTGPPSVGETIQPVETAPAPQTQDKEEDDLPF